MQLIIYVMYIISNYVTYIKDRVLRIFRVSLHQTVSVSIFFPWMPTNGTFSDLDFTSSSLNSFSVCPITCCFPLMERGACQVLSRKHWKEVWHRCKEMTRANERCTHMPAGTLHTQFFLSWWAFPSTFVSFFLSHFRGGAWFQSSWSSFDKVRKIK